MDPFAKVENPSTDILANLGPLRALAGVWEGDRGVDVAPCANGAAEAAFSERITFDPLGPVVNGPQILYGLRYATVACPLGESDPFHEETGYWLWDAAAGQVMRCFMVPRAVTVLAGGSASADASEFEMSAEVGSDTFGILSNPFLDVAFKTVRYELRCVLGADGSFSYEEDTVLQIAGQTDLFHHTDRNVLKKV